MVEIRTGTSEPLLTSVHFQTSFSEVIYSVYRRSDNHTVPDQRSKVSLRNTMPLIAFSFLVQNGAARFYLPIRPAENHLHNCHIVPNARCTLFSGFLCGHSSTPSEPTFTILVLFKKLASRCFPGFFVGIHQRARNPTPHFSYRLKSSLNANFRVSLWNPSPQISYYSKVRFTLISRFFVGIRQLPRNPPSQFSYCSKISQDALFWIPFCTYVNVLGTHIHNFLIFQKSRCTLISGFLCGHPSTSSEPTSTIFVLLKNLAAHCFPGFFVGIRQRPRYPRS